MTKPRTRKPPTGMTSCIAGKGWGMIWMEEEKKPEKSNNKTHKKIEHGGENSYHALCCVFEELENYRNGRG